MESCNDRRTAQDLVFFMEKVATHYPEGKVHIIWDNLNIHYDGAEALWSEFRNHRGRWEPMPFAGDISNLAQDLVNTLDPFLQRWDFSDRKSGSNH